MQRLVVLALGLVLALSGAAAAESADPGYITNPVWTTAPPTAALPANFANADYRSFVPLVCRVQGDVLTVCRPVDTPPPEAFLEEARYAAGVARIGPQDGSGRATDGRDVFLFVAFPAKPGATPPPATEAQAPPAPAQIMTGYSWDRRPGVGAFDRYYPAGARMAHLAGRTSMDCLVGAGGRIVCTVMSETPVGSGFGDAAVMISRDFRCAARTSDGRSTLGGRVRVNITFNPPP